MGFDTPVAFFVFNRPQQTRETFRRIVELQPRTLLLIADGPRGADEEQRCDDTRAIVSRIDWECDLRINFADQNMGCRRRVASGLDWVFNQVEQAIILEDDCLPDASFFRYCHELLHRYSDEPRISMISGDNFQFGQRRTPDSYYFSMIPHIWGWATWRRTWRFFDLHMKSWSMLRETNWLSDLLGHPSVVRFYREMFDRAWRGQVDTWDIPWVFACFTQGGLAVLPETNLVTNIGFGIDATHTKNSQARESNMLTTAIKFPLRHPVSLARGVEADEFTFENHFGLRLTRAVSKAA